MSQRQKQNSVQTVCRCCCCSCNLIHFSDVGDSQTDEVIPVDGVASQEKTGDMNSMVPRATCRGGESGAGAPVEVRVEESQLAGGAC